MNPSEWHAGLHPIGAGGETEKQHPFGHGGSSHGLATGSDDRVPKREASSFANFPGKRGKAIALPCHRRRRAS
jgi:hypothetical protein